MTVSVSELWIYPVKGCRGVALEQMAFDARGPVGDRHWMVVDAAGHFVTQRTDPALARVVPVLDGAGSLVGLEHADADTSGCPVGRSARVEAVVVWSDTASATGCGDAADDWLSARLGRPVRLVEQADDDGRTTSSNWTDAPAPVGFSDGYPLLAACRASLEALNDALATPIAMTRFRPNIVLEGGSAWQEDGWTHVSLGGLGIEFVKPCVRCSVTTVDQASGTRPEPKEPLATLARLRQDDRVGGVTFGVNGIVRSGGGSVLAVGDQLRVGVG